MKKIKTWSDYYYYEKSNPNLTLQLEQFLIEKTKGKERDKALDELIKKNLPSVHHYALKYKWSNIPYEDLVQYGVAGIISAVDKFDNTKGVRFYTYCTHYIIGRLKRALEQYNNLIRLPAHVNLALLRIAELDPYVEISDSDLNKFTSERYKLHHLRIALEAKKQKLVDIDETYDVGETNHNLIDRRIFIETLMATLSEKEQIALQLKFGLNNNKIHSIAEIDRILDVDAENLLASIFKKLRKNFDANIILGLLRDE